MTISALELIVAVAADIDMGASAMGADNHLAPTLLGYEITATLVAVEVGGKGDKGIEVFKCKSHSLKVFLCIYTLNLWFSYTKVQRFSHWTSMFY